mmetsp:Transcript_18741/g.23240  ORF Transcript_18741/g.23240 Transcript_18741/m.23240 type:complete len:459 (+) Transcript_18741:404-1780(+)
MHENIPCPALSLTPARHARIQKGDEFSESNDVIHVIDGVNHCEATASGTPLSQFKPAVDARAALGVVELDVLSSSKVVLSPQAPATVHPNVFSLSPMVNDEDEILVPMLSSQQDLRNDDGKTQISLSSHNLHPTVSSSVESTLKNKITTSIEELQHALKQQGATIAELTKSQSETKKEVQLKIEAGVTAYMTDREQQEQKLPKRDEFREMRRRHDNELQQRIDQLEGELKEMKQLLQRRDKIIADRDDTIATLSSELRQQKQQQGTRQPTNNCHSYKTPVKKTLRTQQRQKKEELDLATLKTKNVKLLQDKKRLATLLSSMQKKHRTTEQKQALVISDLQTQLELSRAAYEKERSHSKVRDDKFDELKKFNERLWEGYRDVKSVAETVVQIMEEQEGGEGTCDTSAGTIITELSGLPRGFEVQFRSATVGDNVVAECPQSLSFLDYFQEFSDDDDEIN